MNPERCDSISGKASYYPVGKMKKHKTAAPLDLTSEKRKKKPKNENNPKIPSLLAVAVLISIALLRPGFGQEIASSEPYSADYGIFSTISDLHEEQVTREDDPRVVNAVKSTMDSVRFEEWDFQDPGTGDLKKETLKVPEPITQSPVVLDALRENPIINNTSILDWILPPPASDQGALNYLLLYKGEDGTIWKLGSIIPKLGIFTDSGIDKWLYIDVDGDPSNGDEIRARMTFAKDLLARDWEVSLFPPTLNFNNAGIRIQVEEVGTRGVGMDGSLYFIKGISYSQKNYIWSVGVGLEDFTGRMSIRVQAREWRAEPDLQLIQRLLQGGLLNLGDLNLLEIVGPFTLSYEFDQPPERMDIYISVMRLLAQDIRDMAYIQMKLQADALHDTIMNKGSMILGVKNTDSAIESLEWKGGEEGDPADSISLGIRYVEFSDDLIDAHINIPSLPGSLRLDLDYTQDGQGRNNTILDLFVPQGLPELNFLEVIYPSWNTSQDLKNWDATKLILYGVPERIHLETTAGVPFIVDDPDTSGLNLLDNFMTQLAGRFYRLGEILREIPRAISEMPSRKGSTMLDCKEGHISGVRYISTSGEYMNGTGDMIAFSGSDEGKPAIFASVNGIKYYRGTFTDTGNDITLSLHSTPNLVVYAISGEERAVLDINGIPDRIRITTSDDRITYQGTSEGLPATIDSVGYRFRDGNLRFDLNIKEISSSLSMIKGEDRVEVVSGSGSIGSIEMFTSDSNISKPIDIPERNFASVLVEDDGSSVGLRLNRLRSLVYNNGTNGFIELSTVAEANFYAVIKDREEGLDMTAAFVPLPSFTHLDMPSIVNTPEIEIPDIMGVGAITDYGDLLFSLENLGRAPITVASSISEGLIGAIGRYSTDLSLSWDLAEEGSTLDLILILDKKGGEEVQEAKWTHGIWMEQKGQGENSSVNGKIFLKGMPTRGKVNLSFSDQLIKAEIDFGDYSPEFDWIVIKTTGVQSRDISMYIKGIPSGIDLLLDLMVFTDLSIGGRMVVDMNVHVEDQRGNPVELGSMIATLIKAEPILSIRQMFLPMITSDLNLHADVEKGVVADYSSSASIDYLYFKITKRIEGRWSQIYAIFHDLPLGFYINMTPNHDFTIQEPFITQGLPNIDIRTEGREMDIFVEYDGSGFGQRGKFQIYADDIGSTSAQYNGEDYEIESDGIGFISLQVDRLPVMEQFTLSSLSLLGMDVQHLIITSEMIYGIYPQIFLKDTRGGSFQIKVSGEVNLGDESFSPELFFITLRTSKIAGLNIPTGLFINKDTSALSMENAEGAVVMPAPLLTGWYMLVSPIFGGGG